MKAARVLVMTLGLVVMTVLGGALGVAAQGPSGTWVSGITIQNQNDTVDAEITMKFYWAAGTANEGDLAYSGTYTIAAGLARTWYVPAHIPDLPDGFIGSVVVSSDQPVVANVNTQLPPDTAGGTPDDPNRIGTSSGVSVPSTTLYFTQLMHDYWGWSSYIAVQNTSDSEASVVVRYYDETDGSEVTAARDTQTIPAYSTRIFYQPENSNLAPFWHGSAVITGTQPLAGIANFYNSGSSKDTAQFHSYNAFSGGETKLYVPRLVKDFYDYQSGFKVQNVGTAPTDVTINYYFGGNTYTQMISSLQPGACAGPYLGSEGHVPMLAGVSGAGSAVMTSSGEPIVATVNEDNRRGEAVEDHEGRGITYNAIVDGSQTDTVFFSQVTSRFYGYSSGIQVQNVGMEATTVTAVLSASGFSDSTIQTTLQPNEAVSWFVPNIVGSPRFNGSAVVTADQPLVGIANMSYRADTVPADGWARNYGDSFLTYNGVNR